MIRAASSTFACLVLIGQVALAQQAASGEHLAALGKGLDHLFMFLGLALLGQDEQEKEGQHDANREDHAYQPRILGGGGAEPDVAVTVFPLDEEEMPEALSAVIEARMIKGGA